jgi:pyridoxine kinase
MNSLTPPAAPLKAVLAISSQVARGSVGLRAAGFAIERLGLSLWKVPTIWLPWHPGHAASLGMPPRSAMSDEVFEESLMALASSPVIGEVGAVLTGYFASAAQVRAACAAIDMIRQVSPDLLVVCDPVSGDVGGTYVSAQIVEALRDELLPRASILTPNRFEAELLAGHPPGEDNNALLAMAQGLGVPRVVITSAFGMMKNATGTLLVEGASAMLAEHALIAGAPHGTGDLFSALLTAHLLMGLSSDKALERATASVFEIVARSVRAGSSELLLAREQASLVSPMAMVTMRRLSVPAREETARPLA